MSVIRHLYVHVPFCTHVCPYCGFFKTRNVPAETRGFVPALLAEARWARANFDVQPLTVYFGGGTPSALSVTQLEELFAGWPWPLPVGEFTFEANPLTVSARKAAVLRAAGVNRVSLGAQAFDTASLKLLGRRHDAGAVRDTLKILRAAGFDNINLDLMFALPGQTLAQWQGTLSAAVALRPEHISAYNLSYEEDTEFFNRLATGVWRADADRDREFFLQTTELLARHGFEFYEISNYARAGFASAHNRAYWRGEDYLGIGPGACATVGLERWQNVADNRRYVEALALTGAPPREIEPLTVTVKHAERVMLGLRTREGVPLPLLAGKDAALRNLEQEGLLVIVNDSAALTVRGRLVADSITELLI
ncbi:MAG: radical SAM family heme chaperone HemW [Verrucomicrobiales bacterium]|jgi:oxygen-independent coproporphyrinogen-3 oxidase|nr:radical SAM family heme chaperone HemW [Verrucomicrobiales bacterium]